MERPVAYMPAIREGAVRIVPSGGWGMVTSLILEDRHEVQLLIVTWAG